MPGPTLLARNSGAVLRAHRRRYLPVMAFGAILGKSDLAGREWLCKRSAP
jgi:hypothetical protein